MTELIQRKFDEQVAIKGKGRYTEVVLYLLAHYDNEKVIDWLISRAFKEESREN